MVRSARITLTTMIRVTVKLKLLAGIVLMEITFVWDTRMS